VKVTVEVTSASPLVQVDRSWLIAAETSIALAATLPCGLKSVMSPVPVGIPTMGQLLRTA
jgi:hypothetical protein